MIKDVERLRKDLISAIRASGESSYARRAPSRKSIPMLERIVNEAALHERHSGGSIELYELMSLAQECLLRYPDALRSQELANGLRGAVSQKVRKRMVRLKEDAIFWRELPLSKEQLSGLGKYLSSRVEFTSEFDIDDPFRHTRKWLSANKLEEEKILRGLRRKGYFSDFSVYFNLISG